MRRTRLMVAAVATAIVSTTSLPSHAADLGTGEAAAPSGQAAQTLLGDTHEVFFDVRRGLPRLAPTAIQRAAARALTNEAGRRVSVTWNRTYGTPRMISAPRGYLTGTNAGTPVSIAREWLVAHADLLGLSGPEIRAMAVIRNHTLPGVDATVVSFEQTFGRIPAADGNVLTVTMNRHGRVLAYAGDPIRSTQLNGTFKLTAADALAKAVRLFAPGFDFTATPTGQTQAGYTVFQRGPFAEVQRVKQVTFGIPGNARPAYSVLFIKSHDEAWSVIVDAETGNVLSRVSLVDHDAEGTVYENYPGAPKGGDPIVVPFGVTDESPGGWVDPSGMAGLPGPTTFGNNASSFEQVAAPLAPTDEWNRPVSPLAQFNYSYDKNWETSEGTPGTFVLDRDPAVTNLFYNHNRIHDEYYKFGFTETAGNFQVNNYGLGGNGGDAVQGLAHSGAATGGDPTYLGRDNANFLTLPDGIPGLTSMYLWEPINDAFEGPYSDGDFDASVIQHEYTHGLSNRYVGGGGLSPLGAQQSGSMGEGWSDFYALNYLWRAGLSKTSVVGQYVTGNDKRGIRNWAYDKNPTTYGDFGYDATGPEVHADGEIWTATLWQLRTALAQKYGNVQGGNIAEHLVTDAMPLTPVDPSFLDARDAILQADTLRYKAKNTNLIWSVFADRGMGKHASTVDGDDTDPKPAFDHAVNRFNGNVKLRLVNDSTGKPIKGARVMIGEFEARATAWNVSDAKGIVHDPVVGGKHTFTVQAPGFGIQHFTFKVPAGGNLTKTVRVMPNLASEASGATLAEVTSQDNGLPATFLMDDTEASAWKTATVATTFNEEPDQSATIKLGKRAKVSEIHISAMKPTTLSRFTMVDRYSVSTSIDGKSWSTVKNGRFAWQTPRPTVADMMMKTIHLNKPVDAAYVKVTIKSIVGETKQYATLAELEVFSKQAKGITPKPAPRDKPVSEDGSILVGNIAQGTLLPGTVPFNDGVTTASWHAAGCSTDAPPAQGADAWVMPLPAGFGDGTHQVRYDTSFQFIGESYLWFFDGDCQSIGGDFAVDGQNLLVAPGAAYVAVMYLYGAGFDFTLTAEQVG